MTEDYTPPLIATAEPFNGPPEGCGIAEFVAGPTMAVVSVRHGESEDRIAALEAELFAQQRVNEMLANVNCELENALRELASYVGAGGYNADVVEASVFRDKIKWGIDEWLKKVAALEAENAKLREALGKVRDLATTKKVYQIAREALE